MNKKDKPYYCPVFTPESNFSAVAQFISLQRNRSRDLHKGPFTTVTINLYIQRLKFSEAGQRTEKKQFLGNYKPNSSQNSYSVETESGWKYLADYVRSSIETSNRSNLYSGAKLHLRTIRLC